MTTVVWFRRDLRITDNPALLEASRRGDVVPLFILDEDGRGDAATSERLPADNGAGRPLGGASRWWLHHSLSALGAGLGGLLLLRGRSAQVLSDVIAATNATAVYWNRSYEPLAVRHDTALKTAVSERGVEARSFIGNVLNEPWEVTGISGKPYEVFSPYWRACRARPLADPLPAPTGLRLARLPRGGERLADWKLLPERPNWAAGWEPIWQPGEAGAQRQLAAFLANGLRGYSTLRDRPDLSHTSRLSPHLHWGEISPRQVAAATSRRVDSEPALGPDGDKLLSEIGWREFAIQLLFHHPLLAERNWRPAFDAYPWRDDPEAWDAWRCGRTGYPMVDAGMRELWQTGWMHNRARMIVASFLVKHLRLHWQRGEAWFWDTLVDADLANNANGWQWVAGSGADAAPYFRIFNPVTQGRKFDPDGAYVRRWCPELARLPAAFIHAPFEAPAGVLAAAGVVLGTTYPKPIVDHARARAAALAGYEAVRARSAGM
jgi:deoxyribodipyrimidine photo-lyase